MNWLFVCAATVLCASLVMGEVAAGSETSTATPSESPTASLSDTPSPTETASRSTTRGSLSHGSSISTTLSKSSTNFASASATLSFSLSLSNSFDASSSTATRSNSSNRSSDTRSGTMSSSPSQQASTSTTASITDQSSRTVASFTASSISRSWSNLASSTRSTTRTLSLYRTRSTSTSTSRSSSAWRTVSVTRSTTSPVSSSHSSTRTPTATHSATRTSTAALTNTRSHSVVLSPTKSMIATPSATKSLTSSISISFTNSTSPSALAASTTVSNSSDVTVTRTPSLTWTRVFTKAITPSESRIGSISNSLRITVSLTITPPPTPTRSASYSISTSSSSTDDGTRTPSPSPSMTPTSVQSSSHTNTLTTTETRTRTCSAELSVSKSFSKSVSNSVPTSVSSTESSSGSSTKGVSISTSTSPSDPGPSPTTSWSTSVSSSLQLTETHSRTVTSTLSSSGTYSLSFVATTSTSGSVSKTRTLSRVFSASYTQSMTLSGSTSETVSTTGSESSTYSSTSDDTLSTTVHYTFSRAPSKTDTPSPQVTHSATSSMWLSVTDSKSLSHSGTYSTSTSRTRSSTFSSTMTLERSGTASASRTVSNSASATVSVSSSSSASETVTPTPSLSVSIDPCNTTFRRDSQHFIDNIIVDDNALKFAPPQKDSDYFLTVTRPQFTLLGTIAVVVNFNTFLRNFYYEVQPRWFVAPQVTACVVSNVRARNATSVELSFSYDPGSTLGISVHDDIVCNATFSTDIFQCQRLTNFSFNFSLVLRATSTDPLIPPVVVQTVSSLASILSLALGATSQLTQSRAQSVMEMVECQFSIVDEISFPDNVLGISFGTNENSYERGTVVGNLAFVVGIGFALVCLITAHAVVTNRRKKDNEHGPPGQGMDALSPETGDVELTSISDADGGATGNVVLNAEPEIEQHEGGGPRAVQDDSDIESDPNADILLFEDGAKTRTTTAAADAGDADANVFVDLTHAVDHTKYNRLPLGNHLHSLLGSQQRRLVLRSLRTTGAALVGRGQALVGKFQGGAIHLKQRAESLVSLWFKSAVLIRFPSVMILPIAFTYDGLVQSSTSLLVHPRESYDVALGVFGLAFALSALVPVARIVLFSDVPLRLVRTRRSDAFPIIQRWRVLRRWLHPRAHWTAHGKRTVVRGTAPEDVAQPTAVQVAGEADEMKDTAALGTAAAAAPKKRPMSLMDRLDDVDRKRFKSSVFFILDDICVPWFALVDLTASFVVGASVGVRVSDRRVCLGLSILCTAAVFAQSLLLLLLRPISTRINLAFTFLVNTTNGIACVLIVASLLAATDVLGLVPTVLSLVGILLTLCQGIVSGVLTGMWLYYKVYRKYRRGGEGDKVDETQPSARTAELRNRKADEEDSISEVTFHSSSDDSDVTADVANDKQQDPVDDAVLDEWLLVDGGGGNAGANVSNILTPSDPRRRRRSSTVRLRSASVVAIRGKFAHLRPQLAPTSDEPPIDIDDVFDDDDNVDLMSRVGTSHPLSNESLFRGLDATVLQDRGKARHGLSDPRYVRSGGSVGMPPRETSSTYSSPPRVPNTSETGSFSHDLTAEDIEELRRQSALRQSLFEALPAQHASPSGRAGSARQGKSRKTRSRRFSVAAPPLPGVLTLEDGTETPPRSQQITAWDHLMEEGSSNEYTS